MDFRMMNKILRISFALKLIAETTDLPAIVTTVSQVVSRLLLETADSLLFLRRNCPALMQVLTGWVDRWGFVSFSMWGVSQKSLKI